MKLTVKSGLFKAKDCVWMRRETGNGRVLQVGWPLIQDPSATNRPSLAQGESQALAPVPGKRYWADPAPRPRFFAPLFFGYFKKDSQIIRGFAQGIGTGGLGLLQKRGVRVRLSEIGGDGGGRHWPLTRRGG